MKTGEPQCFPRKPLKNARDTYYATLDRLRSHGQENEEALRLAMSDLLSTLGQTVGWTLILEKRQSDSSRPDGTFEDDQNISRGHWEAKDTKDDLEKEIEKKRDRNYPFDNIIFEDTQRAILFQGGKRVETYDITNSDALTDLLIKFFSYSSGVSEEFKAATKEFQARLPEHAEKLMARINEEFEHNPRFVAAFNRFLTMCQESINPNISEHAVREMLVQHILIERILRRVFHDDDFTRRNAIAREVEQVIDALTSRTFNRREFLQGLDRFYEAVDQAANTMTNYAQKQGFLNKVYERFFQGYSKKKADTHGIVYTPQEIVHLMCRFVDSVLKREFNSSLSKKGVTVLDPCVGTGNFIVNIMRYVNRRQLERMYEEGIFCNEVMLLPYYIATLNIEHTYFELKGEYKPFEGISFVDTLDMTRDRPYEMFSATNGARIERQRNTDITVIIGNPPYNVGQINENDNNKNRVYPTVDQRIRETYGKDSQAQLHTKLYDMYVRFFRWATDRLGDRDGVICFVSNNGFLRGVAFDGMRKHLAQDFTHIYHLDLGGNARKGGGGSVFNIMVGVGITILVRKRASKQQGVIHYHAIDDTLLGGKKLAVLKEINDFDAVAWDILQPDDRHTWLTHGLHTEFDTFIPMGTKEAKAGKDVSETTLFKIYSLGVATNRDEWVYDFDRERLATKLKRFVENYNYEVFRASQRKPTPEQIDSFVNSDKSFLKWTDRLKEAMLKGRTLVFDPQQVRRSLYRPFCHQLLYFDHLLNQRRYQQHRIFPTPATEEENMIIGVSSVGHRAPFTVLATSLIPNLTLNVTDGFQCFPFYTYNEDGTNRQENITDWALQQFQARCGNDVTKWDIFYYIYAVLHHPVYRERYAKNLKRDLPRIPLPTGAEDFTTLAMHGKSLADLHIGYESVAEYDLDEIDTDGWGNTWRVEKMQLSKDRTQIIVNSWLTLSGIPPACFEYRLGNRSALEWVIDQYQVKTDKRSGIVNDPNREDDHDYIVNLVKRVVTVSVETVRIVGEIGRVDVGMRGAEVMLK